MDGTVDDDVDGGGGGARCACECVADTVANRISCVAFSTPKLRGCGSIDEFTSLMSRIVWVKVACTAHAPFELSSLLFVSMLIFA